MIAKFQDLRQVPTEPDDERPDDEVSRPLCSRYQDGPKTDPAAIEKVSRAILESEGRVNLHDYR
jgi:hypothetical protein